MRVPKEWSFDADGVAEAFDEHVLEQLPWYPLVTRAVAHAARHYVTNGGTVYDVGASTGNVGRALGPCLRERGAHLIAIEASPAMCSQWQPPNERVGATTLWTMSACDVDWEKKDPFDLAIFFLVLMFIAPCDREVLLARVWDRVKPGGAMIVVDRTASANGHPATVLWRLTLSEKLGAGADPSAIIAKELSLAGVQRPIDARILPGDPVEFFRFGDFAGWLIEKPEV